MTLDVQPAGLPAIVMYRPPAGQSQADFVAGMLDEIETAVLSMFPAWMPAEGQFRPYLADLAEHAIQNQVPQRGRFPREMQAAGLAHALAESYGRHDVAVLVAVPDGLAPDEELTLVAACESVARWRRLRVWLVGDLVSVDWLRQIPLSLPDTVRLPDTGLLRDTVSTLEGDAPTERPVLLFPPIAGRPHPGSAAQRALEHALSAQPWAAEREWNQLYERQASAIPTRLHLVWWRERCVVQVDGPDHREPLRHEADRRRDEQLQHHGYEVLHLADARIANDLDGVVADIERLVRGRRLSGPDAER
jgi:very-short-patch-repair endonuclease